MNFSSFHSRNLCTAPIACNSSMIGRINHNTNASTSKPSDTTRILRTTMLAITVLTLALAAAPAANAQFNVLYNFGTKSGDPENPSNPGIIAQGRDGNMYSTTVYGGTNSLGTIFKITPAGNVIYLVVPLIASFPTRMIEEKAPNFDCSPVFIMTSPGTL